MDIADQTLTHYTAPTAVLSVLGSGTQPVSRSRSHTGTPVVLDTRAVTGRGGAPDRTILNSPRFLAPLGYRSLCAYMHPPADPGFEAIRRQAVRHNAPLIAIADRGPWDWRVVTELLTVCRRERVAIWHGHDANSNSLGLVLRRFWPMRLVATVHGWDRTARTPGNPIDQHCLPRYDRVICVSDTIYDTCLNGGVSPERLVLLENAIDAEEHIRQQSVAEAKARLGLPASGHLVGVAGRLAREKGFVILLRSLRALLRRGLDVRLVIVGEGGDAVKLERLVSEHRLRGRVVRPGWQADNRASFEAMDLFAQSSVREGLPDELLEAMALGVPVVATRISAVPRLVHDGRNGLLVTAGDEPGLTAALFGLLTNDRLRDLFRRAGRRTVEVRYSLANRTQKLKRIYDDLLAECPASSGS